MIYEALMDIQQRLKAPKNQRNNFGNYNYRSCEDILEAVKPLLAKNKVVLTLSDDMVEVGGRVYVKATATLSDGKESISTSAFAREDESQKGMTLAQLSGSCSSYANKYAMGLLFCLDDNKDADATNTHGKDEEEQPVCEKCGKKIEPYEYKGKMITAKRHVAGSVDKYGKILCPDCINESKNN